MEVFIIIGLMLIFDLLYARMLYFRLLKDYRTEIIKMLGDDYQIVSVRNAHGPERNNNPFEINLSYFYNGSLIGTMAYNQIKVIEAVHQYSNQKTKHWLLIKTSLIQGYEITITK
jgi:hypothetical protein